MINFGQIAVGILVLLLVTGGLLYLFYSRTNAVEKTGYGSLIMLSVVSILIPVFWIMEGGNQAAAQVQQHEVALERGMDLYAQGCTYGCYTIKDNKLIDPKYNGYTINALNQLNDDDLHRIIAGGVYNPSAPPLANLSVIPKSDKFGGTLQSDYVEYLFQFIRSASPDYLKKNSYPPKNGFNGLVDYLQNNYPTQYQAAVSAGQLGQFGVAKDMTTEKAVTINIVGPQPGESCTPACYSVLNAKVKVGTVITWVNNDSAAHTVSAIVGTNTAAPKVAPQIFDSGLSTGMKTGEKYTHTVTEADYTFNADHTVIYYCQFHPGMLAELTIVP